MNRASIISIGNELLSGRTVDSNAAYLSRKLASIGITVISRYTAGDNTKAIVRFLQLAAGRAELVLVTGGLGATADDLTRYGLAEFLKADLKLQPDLLEQIRHFFVSRNQSMPENNKAQACLPAGTTAITNPTGTAPGIIAEKDGKLFVFLPGVPSEARKMFEESVIEDLNSRVTGPVTATKKIKCFGASESAIAGQLGDMCRRDRNPLINFTVDGGVITLEVIATADDKTSAENLVDKDTKSLRQILGSLIYGTAEQKPAEVVAERLLYLGKTVTVAESCTGGLVAKLLTDIPGSSGYFRYGWVTYSNAAKTSQLGVPAGFFKDYGAVSSRVAEAMATGAAEKSRADFAVAVTGIAGPSGGGRDKPVGLVYVGISSNNRCHSERFVFSGDRERIRLFAAQTALNLLRLEIS